MCILSTFPYWNSVTIAHILTCAPFSREEALTSLAQRISHSSTLASLELGLQSSALRVAFKNHGEAVVENWWAPVFDAITSSNSLRAVSIDLGGRVQQQHEASKGRIAHRAAQAISSRVALSV